MREAAAIRSPLSPRRRRNAALIGEVLNAGGDDGAAVDTRQRTLVAEILLVITNNLNVALRCIAIRASR